MALLLPDTCIVNKRAFLVVGPESSGTRLVTRLLIDAGCHGSDKHFGQPFDSGIPDAPPDLAVWRRSVPHNHRWPNITRMVNLLRNRGYSVQMIVTTRDWYAMIQSQVKAGHVTNMHHAYANLQRAYTHIFSNSNVEYIILSYENLVQRPKEAIAALFHLINLEPPEKIEYIYDGNAKWYNITNYLQ